jgi:hypothetical protein
MFGLDVIEFMTPSGHPSIINKIVRSSAWSFGHSDPDPSSVDRNTHSEFFSPHCAILNRSLCMQVFQFSPSLVSAWN